LERETKTVHTQEPKTALKTNAKEIEFIEAEMEFLESLSPKTAPLSSASDPDDEASVSPAPDGGTPALSETASSSLTLTPEPDLETP